MNLLDRINAFDKLGQIMNLFSAEINWPGFETGLNEQEYNDFNGLIKKTKQYNGWFTEGNIRFTLAQWGEVLSSDKLTNWLSSYDSNLFNKNKKVAIIMAGNIPLVGFHDLLTVLLSGNHAMIKLSSNDDKLLPEILNWLVLLEPRFKSQFSIVPKLSNFEAVIATGSDNSAMYFESYFAKYPHVIRKNRTSVAVLTGEETEEELLALGSDIFQYFGLGCRNVTKLYVPKGYDLDNVFKGLFPWKDIIHHNKYANNYDYNKAIYMMNQNELIENGFILFKEDKALHSPLGVLFYEYYNAKEDIDNIIKENETKIQAVVSSAHIPFGEAQKPKLNDYADGVDIMDFLLNL